MYAEHFGFKRPLFGTIATGTDVFLGPQAAATIKAVRKGLSVQDAVITVTGPVGVGKTAIVGRALDAMGGKQTRIRIGRMSIAHDEILDYLLDILGVSNKPASTIRRIAVFRAVLAQKRQEDERVFVIVEDGTRLGEDPLAELEALTAADGGAGGGAAILIMGDSSLNPTLEEGSLERLNQRVRLRHTLHTLSEGEMTGYLKHCIRASGGDFDTIFENGAATVLSQLSGGIPRVCNNLVNSALSAAAEQSASRVDVDLLTRIAKDEYGLTTESSSADVSQIAETLVPLREEFEGAEPEIELTQSRAAPLPDFAEGTAEKKPAPEPMPAEHEEPELFNDTIPELTTLTKEVIENASLEDGIPTLDVPEASAPDSKPKPAPESKASNGEAIAEESKTVPGPDAEAIPELAVDTADNDVPELALGDAIDEIPELAADAAADEVPELSLETAAEPPTDGQDSAAEPAVAATAMNGTNADEGETDADQASVDDAVPAWERDPTLAELRPDIEALENAMAESNSEADPLSAPAAAAAEVDTQDSALNDIPELRLEESIQQSIAEATAALEKHDSTIAEGLDADKLAEAAPEPVAEKQADRAIEKIARGLARAKTLDDVDDQMAETLFGEEFSMIAAEVAASCADMDFDDEDDDESQELSVVEPAHESTPDAASKKAAPAARRQADSSPSARLRTVQALNAGKSAPKRPAAAKPGAAPGKAPSSAPTTIENQFADIAATMKPQPALVIDDVDDDDDDDGKKGGFFSRFKRS